MDLLVYKIVTADAWGAAQKAGIFHGAQVDLNDGFIHFSSAEQVRETASRHFSGQENLLLVGFRSADLGASLKWEPSRGGALFPHLYASLAPALAVRTESLVLGRDGAHIFPADLA